MSDGAGSAEVLTIDAQVMPAQVRPVSEGRRFAGVLVYVVVAIIWYSVIRVAVLAGWALPWVFAPKTQTAAAMWMLFFEPIGLAIGAYLTMRTNVRNRPFHRVLTWVVFASIVLGHITFPIGNPYVARALPGLSATAWAFQAAFVALGAFLGYRKTRPVEIKIPKMLLPPRKKRK